MIVVDTLVIISYRCHPIVIFVSHYDHLCMIMISYFGILRSLCAYVLFVAIQYDGTGSFHFSSTTL